MRTAIRANRHPCCPDPVQQQLNTEQNLYVIARPCFVEAMHKGSLIGGEKAIRVPFVKNHKVPLQAFSYHTEVRHVLVEEGFRMVGDAAWRSCHRLQIVHLPDTVVSLRQEAFCRRYVLREVTAPGCRHFGTKVFEQCCSLTQIGTTLHSENLLAPQAQFRSRAFEGCTALRHLNWGKTECESVQPHRSLPECFFLEAGIVTLSLLEDFNWIGPAACERCQKLQSVDLFWTGIVELLGSTFAHCLQLQQLSLPHSLRIIGQEAFLLCVSLQEVSIPPSLLYIARRAFAGCEKLRVATLYGRLPTSPGSLAHNRLSHSSGTVRNLSLTLPNTSENFKRCTSCSQTLAPFSHTSQTNWP